MKSTTPAAFHRAAEGSACSTRAQTRSAKRGPFSVDPNDPINSPLGKKVQSMSAVEFWFIA